VLTTKMLTVLIADGHAPTRASLRRAIGEDERFEICAEIGDAAGAVAAAVRGRPDVCVLDAKLPGGGLSAAWEISARLPRVKLVMLTMSAEDCELLAAVRAGAEGLLLKTAEFDHLPDVLAGVCAGEAAVDPAFVTRLLKHFRTREPRWRRPLGPSAPAARPSGAVPVPPQAHLTSREWEVLELLSEGLSTADISRSLIITRSAVRVHIAAIVRKLGVSDRAAAVEILRRPRPDRSDN
jgi:DNA-binding NarL/FixJ family response regulator